MDNRFPSVFGEECDEYSESDDGPEEEVCGDIEEAFLAYGGGVVGVDGLLGLVLEVRDKDGKKGDENGNDEEDITNFF